jgi:glycosyltransferase involved in cell wall biosynthesis
MKTNPLISVIVPIYNGAETLEESIRSILNQSYRKFELILINDGSTDNSLEKIKSFQDSRIIVVNQKNKGLAKTLNIGIKKSNGELIARQDQDDISLNNRFDMQVREFLIKKNLVLLGSNGIKINKNSEEIGKFKFPTKSNDLKFLLNFYNPFIHSSVMMKTKTVKLAGLYSELSSNQPPEDFELWNRMKNFGEIANLDTTLIKYRCADTSMSTVFSKQIDLNYEKLVIGLLHGNFGIPKVHGAIMFNVFFRSKFKRSMRSRFYLFQLFVTKMTNHIMSENYMSKHSLKFIIKNSIKILIK